MALTERAGALTQEAGAPPVLACFPEASSLFFSDTYTAAWLRHLSSGRLQPHVDRGPDGQTRAVFPIVEEPERIAGLRRRIWTCVGWNAAWYPQSFFPVDAVGAEWFLDHLRVTRAEWDGALLAAPARLADLACGGAGAHGLRVLGRQEQVLPYVSLSDGWDAYWAARSPNLRKNVRNLSNRARDAGLRTGCLGDGEDPGPLLQRLFQLHQERWASRGQTSRYAEGARRRRFLETLVPALQSEGKVWLPYLAVDGELVAVALCFVDGTTVRYSLPSFDVAWGHLSPGKLLLHHVLRSAAERGAADVDLGPGQDAYKGWWATGERRHARVMLSQGDPVVWAQYRGAPALRRTAARRARAVLGHPALRPRLPAPLRGFVDRGPA